MNFEVSLQKKKTALGYRMFNYFHNFSCFSITLQIIFDLFDIHATFLKQYAPLKVAYNLSKQQ